ncbi:MAG: hypothetical protein EBX41_04655 [Chitinophagia bacterium]|nr:hypothetical protein [Chitinophagia bacterium]
MEFYILLRGGLPNITLQILSNHYNATRNEYYKEISKVSTTKNLRGFISYAIIGLRDGLEETLKTIQKSLTELMWKNFIYDTFANVEGQKEVIKRQRILSLHFPITGSYTVTEIPKLNVEIAYNYATVSEKTLTRDLDELVSLNMLNKMEHKYSSNISILNQQLPPYKGQKGL